MRPSHIDRAAGRERKGTFPEEPSPYELSSLIQKSE